MLKYGVAKPFNNCSSRSSSQIHNQYLMVHTFVAVKTATSSAKSAGSKHPDLTITHGYLLNEVSRDRYNAQIWIANLLLTGKI